MDGLSYFWLDKVNKLAKKLFDTLGENRPVLRAGFTLIELILVIVVIGILASIALPTFHRIKEKAKEAEAKANLHNIQLNLERFSVDFIGDYPPYLIGGDNAYRPNYGGISGLMTGSPIETPLDFSSDALIRQGYVDCYPRNPFIRNSKAVFQFQVGSGDALRNGLSDSTLSGTRFGPYGDLMGQVLCDPRWLSWSFLNRETNTMDSISTWSNVQFKCYDVWEGNRPRPYLPGSFMYKSMGEVMPTISSSENAEFIDVGKKKMKKFDNRGRATIPLNNSTYVLAAVGSIRTKGLDILGEEPIIIFAREGRMKVDRPDMFIYNPTLGRYKLPQPSGTSFQLMGIPSWTRGVNRSHVGPLWGSPFTLADSSAAQLTPGNPNGIRDAVILVLTPDATFTE